MSVGVTAVARVMEGTAGAKAENVAVVMSEEVRKEAEEEVGRTAGIERAQGITDAVETET